MKDFWFEHISRVILGIIIGTVMAFLYKGHPSIGYIVFEIFGTIFFSYLILIIWDLFIGRFLRFLLNQIKRTWKNVN
jgi:hypothetical protein